MLSSEDRRRAAARALRALEAGLQDAGPDQAQRRAALLDLLRRAPLGSARAVERLHEALCFLRAYPDDAQVLAQVAAMLEAFERRADLRRHAEALADTGIAGTEVQFSFFAPMACWLARRHGASLSVDWEATPRHEGLGAWLYALRLPAEQPGVDAGAGDVRAQVAAMKRDDESDAEFLVRLFERMPASAAVRRAAFEQQELWFRMRCGGGAPSRTLALHPPAETRWREAPLAGGRPDLRTCLGTPPRSVRAVSRVEGRALIELAREAMVTRARDLDSFAFGDERDVRRIDCGDGLEFACIGLVPEERIVLEGLYAMLTLKNGVPVGYVLISGLYGSSDIAYNVFESFRGAEAGAIYGRVLGVARALFGSDSFTVYPYQLGHGNEEGLRSGAWWFYQKLGYRSRDPEVLALMERELERMRRDPRHRSSRATLSKLARRNVFWSRGRARRDVIGALPLEGLARALQVRVARRFGSARDEAPQTLCEEAIARLGLGRLVGWRPAERLALERWSPLLLALPGLERWTAPERAALAEVVRAKGGRREDDFVARFDAHRRLRRAVAGLAHAAARAEARARP